MVRVSNYDLRVYSKYVKVLRDMPKNFPSSGAKLASEEGSQFSTALVQEIVGKFKNDDDSQDKGLSQ